MHTWEMELNMKLVQELAQSGSSVLSRINHDLGSLNERQQAKAPELFGSLPHIATLQPNYDGPS